MAIYNVNQNMQLYVVKTAVKDSTVKLDTLTNEGDLRMAATDVTKTGDNQIWFNHVGKGGLTRTDLIDLDKVCYATLTKKEAMRRYPKKAVVKLNPDVNGGNPISGQDYVLRIQINNFLAPGDACVYIKSSAVHATATMDAEEFYKKMAASLELNFKREKDATGVEFLKFQGDANGVTITEVTDQPWRLGVLSQEPVNFEVIPSTVMWEGEEYIWAELNDKGIIEVKADKTLPHVGNGRQIADLEYFCQAERGDMFRNMGWPNNIDVKYMVEPEKEYDVLTIHYYYSGSGVQVHKSEKDMTFVSAEDGVIDSIKTALEGKEIKVQVVEPGE